VVVYCTNASTQSLNPTLTPHARKTLITIRSIALIPSLTAYILAHWMFGFKYFTVALLLHYRGALTKGKEIALRVVNVSAILMIVMSSVVYGVLRWLIDSWENSPAYLPICLNIVAWCLFFALCMGLLTLLMGLILIRRTLKDASHLMVNEKYMALHFSFLLLAVLIAGPIIQSKVDSKMYYLWWIINVWCDFISALILAYIFAQNASAERASANL